MNTRTQHRIIPVTKFVQRQWPAAMLCAALFFGNFGRAADVYESFTYEGKTYTKARLVEATPLDLLFVVDGTLGSLRIPRRDLPSELKEKYPYEPIKAEEFEKQKAAKAKVLQEQQRRDVYNALLRQEKEVQTAIDTAGGQLTAVQKDVKSWRARPKQPGKKVTLNQLLETKAQLEDKIDALRKQLETIRQQQILWR